MGKETQDVIDQTDVADDAIDTAETGADKQVDKAADATKGEKPKATPKLGEDDPAPKLGDEPADDAEDAAADKGDDADKDGEADDDTPVEYKFEAPEGAPPYREAIVEAFSKVAGELKLSQEHASKLLESMVPVVQKDVSAHLAQQIETATTEWQKQLEERHGDKLPDVIRRGNKALKTYASPELRRFIAESPLASHPDFIDMLAAVGQRVTNDRSPKNGASTHARKLSAEEEAAREYEEEARQGR